MPGNHRERMHGGNTLSRDLVYLFRPLWVSFKLSLMVSKDDLIGFCSFASVTPAWFGSTVTSVNVPELDSTRMIARQRTDQRQWHLAPTAAYQWSTAHS